MEPRAHGWVQRTLVLSTLLVAACVRPSAERPRAPVAVPQWLIGAWALKGQRCDGDGTIVYRGDGSWIAEGATGTWRLRKDRLFTEVTADADSPDAARLSFEDRLQQVGHDELIATRSNGVVRHMKRCPATASTSRHGRRGR